MKQLNKQTSGFTIVELLVVIVIIGILSAISFVSFSAVSAQARATTMKADLNSLEKSYELYRVANGNYPASYAVATSSSVINSGLASKMIEMTGTAQQPCPTTPKDKICVYAYATSAYSEYALVYWDYKSGNWTHLSIGMSGPGSADRWRIVSNYGSGQFPVRP